MAKKEKPTTKLCKHCKTEIPYDAKVCPQCRRKVKGGLLKWILLAVVVLIAIAAMGGNGSESKSADSSSKPPVVDSAPAEEIVYSEYQCTDLFDELKDNALKAEKNHQDQYVEVHGYLSNIDSDGKYISIGADKDDYEYLFQTIQCHITDKSQIDQILELSVDQKITIRGQITSIGEVLGYRIDILEIVD